MLRITLHDSSEATTFKLEGKLAGPWVRELEKCWIPAQSTAKGRGTEIDLTQVSFIDIEGRALLERMAAAGAELIAAGPLTKAMCEEARRKGRRLASLLCCAAVFTAMLAPRAVAQPESPTQVTRLTLRDAVQMALKQNPQVQVAALTLAQSQQTQAIARATMLPQINTQATERRQRLNAEALFGQRFPGIPQHIGPFQNFQAGGYFSLPLDLTLWRRWLASKDTVKATGAQEQTVREQYASLVVSQYLGSLRGWGLVLAGL
jgi:hypothetical protein